MFSGSLRMHFKHLFLAKTNMKRDLKFYKIPKYGLISIYQNIQKQTEMFILILEMINQCFEVKIRIIYHQQMKNICFLFLGKGVTTTTIVIMEHFRGRKCFTIQGPCLKRWKYFRYLF